MIDINGCDFYSSGSESETKLATVSRMVLGENIEERERERELIGT